MRGWRQHQWPDATVGVLTVPLKGAGDSPRLVCTRCSLTESHPITAWFVLDFRVCLFTEVSVTNDLRRRIKLEFASSPEESPNGFDRVGRCVDETKDGVTT
jgi:hypothetical protein